MTFAFDDENLVWRHGEATVREPHCYRVMESDGMTSLLQNQTRLSVVPTYASGELGIMLLAAVSAFAAPEFRSDVARMLDGDLATFDPASVMPYSQDLMDADAAALPRAAWSTHAAPYDRRFEFDAISGPGIGFRSCAVVGIWVSVQCRDVSRGAGTGWQTSVSFCERRKDGVNVSKGDVAPRAAALLGLGTLGFFRTAATPRVMDWMLERARTTLVTGTDPSPAEFVRRTAIRTANPVLGGAYDAPVPGPGRP